MNFVKQTVSQIQQVNSFPDIPVYVIKGGKENLMIPENARQKRLENQLNLLCLSPNSKHIIAEKKRTFSSVIGTKSSNRCNKRCRSTDTRITNNLCN